MSIITKYRPTVSADIMCFLGDSSLPETFKFVHFFVLDIVGGARTAWVDIGGGIVGRRGQLL